MPHHKQVTTCRKSDGPVSKMCTCEHCTLSICAVCGSGEGTLTTDCPGTKVAYDRQQEVFETNLDYTDERGWHLEPSGANEPLVRRSPRFEDTKMPPEPPRIDPRTLAAPSIDWARVDRTMDLQHDLTLKAIAWVLADRACEDSAASERLAQEATAHLRGKSQLDVHDQERMAALERLKIDFQIACRRVEKCDDEFRQTARRLVAELEERAPSKASYGLKDLARQYGID